MLTFAHIICMPLNTGMVRVNALFDAKVGTVIWSISISGRVDTRISGGIQTWMGRHTKGDSLQTNGNPQLSLEQDISK